MFCAQPIVIEISFELTGGYAASMWLFSVLYIPPALALLMFPEPVRMSVISDRLQEIQRERELTVGGRTVESSRYGSTASTAEQKMLENRRFWSRCLCGGFAVFLLWYVGAQVGYGMYITTYAIEYLGASAARGRYLASANWAGLFVGRFLAVPLSQRVSALNMVWLDLAGVAVGTALLFFSRSSAYVVWLSAVLVGLSMASVWPCVFVWAEALMPVTGVFASIMVGGGSLGEFLVPAAQGNVMAAFGAEWFNHVMFAMAALLIVSLAVNVVLAKRLAHFL